MLTRIALSEILLQLCVSVIVLKGVFLLIVFFGK